MREQLLNLLAQGASRDEALRITGASEDLLTELLSDKDFTADIAKRRGEIRGELIEQGYAKLEQSVQTQIQKEVNSGMLDVTSLCRILETSAKNRVLHRAPVNHYNNPSMHLTVELKIPQAAETQGITVDEKTNQIIAIGERNMTGMPIQGVKKLFDKLQQKQKETDLITEDLEDVLTKDYEQQIESICIKDVA